MAKGDTVSELHALHVAALRIQNEINRNVHVLGKTRIDKGTPFYFASATPTFKLPSGNNTPAPHLVVVTNQKH